MDSVKIKFPHSNEVHVACKYKAYQGCIGLQVDRINLLNYVGILTPEYLVYVDKIYYDIKGKEISSKSIEYCLCK